MLQEAAMIRQGFRPARPPTAKSSTPISIHRAMVKAYSCRESTTGPDHYLVRLCLKSVRLRLSCGTKTTFEGVMLPGGVHVVGPRRHFFTEFDGDCEFIELEVESAHLHARQAAAANGQMATGLDGCILRDGLIEQLGRTLLSDAACRDPIYAGALAEAMLARLAHLAELRPGSLGLQKWRLKRVQAVIEERISETISLADLAAAAGLSRMHFAAQFRASTGYSPHEYLTYQRIESAKTLLATTQTSLAEVALCVGFHAQAHFTTVFKRLTGETPARWRKARSDCPMDADPPIMSHHG